MVVSMGLDPLTAGLITSVLPDFLHFLTGSNTGSPAQPSAAQIQAAVEAQQRAAAARTKTYLIAGGIAVVGIGAVLLLLRRRK